jgi:hypothetical protein
MHTRTTALTSLSLLSLRLLSPAAWNSAKEKQKKERGASHAGPHATHSIFANCGCAKRKPSSLQKKVENGLAI